MAADIDNALNVLIRAGLKLGINWQKQFRELITDIAKCENITVKKVLKSSSIQLVLKDKKLTGSQKLSKIKTLLQERRFPLYSQTMKSFKKRLAKLKINPKLKVIPTPYFENEDLRFEFSYDTDDELKEIRMAIKKVQEADLVRSALNSTLALMPNKHKNTSSKQEKRDFLIEDRKSGVWNVKKSRLAQFKEKTGKITASSKVNLERIIVEKSALKESLTKKIIKRFSSLPVEYVDRAKTLKKGLKSSELLIAINKGSFVKKCPGTPKYGCCDYYVLNLGIGCTYNCTYCYLHQYMNSPFIVYVNVKGVIEEVKQFCAGRFNKIVRLGSGEFIDSIGFSEIVDFNEILVPSFSRIDNLLFEIKTKSSNVKSLLSLKHRGKVVVSFSFNSQEIANKEERKADSLQKRIKAARLCQEAGYKIGFHFDPLIYYDGWQKGYSQAVKMIFEHIKPENIAWISLGALRFNKALKPIMQNKFPNSKIIYGELVPGIDNKLRYFIAIRKKLFQTLVCYIRLYSEQVPVYLCMENKSLAEEVGAIANFSVAK